MVNAEIDPANEEPQNQESWLRKFLNERRSHLPPSLRKKWILGIVVVVALLLFSGLYYLAMVLKALEVLVPAVEAGSRPENRVVVLLTTVCILLLLTATLAYWYGKRKGMLIGVTKGINIAYSDNDELFGGLVRNCSRFIESFKSRKLNSLGKSVVQGLGDQPDSWTKYFENAAFDYTESLGDDIRRRWEVLAEATTTQYSVSTIKRRGGENGNPLLLSNFGMYAECVNSIFQALSKSDQSFGNTVTIWTLLDKPLSVWYNMVRVSNGQFYCTQPWWEAYKDGVASLNDTTKFQMRRLVVNKLIKTGLGASVHPNRLCLIGETNPVKVGDAKQMNFAGIDLTEDLHRLLVLKKDTKEFDHLSVYLIGRRNRRRKKKKSAQDLYNLVQHFQKTYHKQYKQNLKQEDKGVFYCYTKDKSVSGRKELNGYLDFDDIFLVEFSEEGGRVRGFGIALIIDEPNDTVGIKLLCGNALDKTREALMRKWNSGSDKIVFN